MKSWSKVRAVAWFEFLSTVKRKGYLIATFGMPVFLAAYAGVISFISNSADFGDKEVRSFAVVDEAGVLDLRASHLVSLVEMPEQARETAKLAGPRAEELLERGDANFEPYLDMASAEAALRESEVTGVYRIPADYIESGEIEYLARDDAGPLTGNASEQFSRLLRNAMLERAVPENLRARVETPVASRVEWTLEQDGSRSKRDLAAQIARFAVPAVFALLLFITLMMTTGYLIEATGAEKESKVVEVLLSSANPDEILLGKLFGLGAAGMLQVVVWFSMLIVGVIVAASVMTAFGVELPWKLILVGAPYFFATYFFMGSLVLASGSLGGNLKESQQMSVVFMLLPVTPLMFLAVLLSQPHGLFAQILTWLPFTSAITLLIRMVLEPEAVSWFQIIGSFVVLLVSTWLAISFGARLYRVGLLLTGARPKLREILRQARLKA